MYVCICNSVTDRDILTAVDNGATSLEDLSDTLKVATCCGRCADCARNLLNKAHSHSVAVTLDLPVMFAGAA